MLNFLIAGVQKGGTTALWQFLREHPRIALPAKKELHFFDDERRDWSRPSYEFLDEAVASEDGASVRGEATPIYSYWTPSLPRIAAYNPEKRLILSLRDPIVRAYSHWRMEQARGAENLPFHEAIREGRERLKGESPISRANRVFSYVDRGFYASQLDRVFAIFAREQVLVLRQNDLAFAHHQTLDRVCAFLGVAAFETYPDPQLVFSHGADPLGELDPVDVDYLRHVYAHDLKRLADIYEITFE